MQQIFPSCATIFSTVATLFPLSLLLCSRDHLTREGRRHEGGSPRDGEGRPARRVPHPRIPHRSRLLRRWLVVLRERRGGGREEDAVVDGAGSVGAGAGSTAVVRRTDAR